MSTLPILVILSLILRVSTAIFDIEELKTFNYGIDIRSEPVVMKAEGESEEEVNVSVVKMTSKYGQMYQCSFPNTIQQEKQKEEQEKVAMETGIPDLLKPMESGPCLQMTKDWWSYEFCYGKHIKQFHLAEDGRIDGDVLTLGHYESEYNWDDEDTMSDQTRKESNMRRYHTQQYVNGTKCDLNGKLRKTEVRFVCEERGDYIARLDEPETCSYIMTVHTMKICHHPYMKPPSPTQVVSITCNPLLTDGQYQTYLDDLEARKLRQREEYERRKAAAEAAQAEKDKLAEEKAKYYKQNQIFTDEEEDVEGVVEEETEEGFSVGEDSDTIELPTAGEGAQDWNSVMDEARKMAGAMKKAFGEDAKVETLVKVVESPEDLKNVFKEAIEELQKVRAEKLAAKQPTGPALTDEEQEESDVEHEHDELDINDDDSDDENDDENDAEDGDEAKKFNLGGMTKALNAEKQDRERLTELMNKLEREYHKVMEEADPETMEAYLAEYQATLKKLTEHMKVQDGLLSKLDKAIKENADPDMKAKSQHTEPEDSKTSKGLKAFNEDSSSSSSGDNGVKVSVSHLKSGQLKDVEKSSLIDKQAEALEKSVQEELEKAGIGSAGKFHVKIIRTEYDGEDGSLHILSEQESETFRNMIVDMIGGKSEVDREQTRQDKQEENYSFVFGQETHTDAADTRTDSETADMLDLEHSDKHTVDSNDEYRDLFKESDTDKDHGEHKAENIEEEFFDYE